MNTKGEKVQSITLQNVGYNRQEVFGEDNWSFNKLQFIVPLSRFSLCIRKVNKHENGLELVVSLGFCNSEHMNIPKPYLQTFLKNVNTNSTTFDYQHDTQSDAFKLTCSLSQEILKNFTQTIEQCQRKIKEDQRILESALQLIGIMRSKGKNLLKLKKEQLSLRKQVIQLLKNKKDCQSSSLIKTSYPPIFYAKKIEEVNCQGEQLGKLRKGGYFQVRPVKCRIFDDQGDQIQKNLACKSARSSKKQQIVSAPRLQKEVLLASMLVDPTHFVKYYVEQNPSAPNNDVRKQQRQKLYMEYFPDLLKEKLYKTGFTIKNIIKLSKQLISAVKTMHQSGIVHRDLKPQNIIIENKEGQLCLKIIDFGQSTLMNENFDKKSSLGCTLPYSPVECITKDEIGFNKPEIDLWSITMILYEMTFRHLPMFYSRCIGPEIIQTWKAKKQFSIFPLYRKKSGLRAAEEIVSLLCISGLQLQQKQRLKIQTLQKILETIEKYSEMV